MFKCKNCGNIFEEPDTFCTDNGYDTEYAHIPYYEYEDFCPFCKSDDLIREYEEEEETDE